jgi:hypothetical protein
MSVRRCASPWTCATTRDDRRLPALARAGRPAGGRQRLDPRAGIRLEIYLTGDRLFMIMEVDGTFSAQAKAAPTRPIPRSRPGKR